MSFGLFCASQLSFAAHIYKTCVPKTYSFFGLCPIVKIDWRSNNFPIAIAETQKGLSCKPNSFEDYMGLSHDSVQSCNFNFMFSKHLCKHFFVALNSIIVIFLIFHIVLYKVCDSCMYSNNYVLYETNLIIVNISLKNYIRLGVLYWIILRNKWFSTFFLEHSQMRITLLELNITFLEEHQYQRCRNRVVYNIGNYVTMMWAAI